MALGHRYKSVGTADAYTTAVTDLLADRAYTPAPGLFHHRPQTPPIGRPTPTERTGNPALATSRAPVERAMARLKSWRISRRSRCGPNRMTPVTTCAFTPCRLRFDE
ncbi:transposase family protein [Streptomyces sp. NPDC002308]